MLFSSITFLYYFLPSILVIYYLAPKRMKNYVLLLGSLVFYFFGEPRYTVLLLVSSVSDYFHSLYIKNHRGKKSATIALISSIIINLGMLGFFKYSDFFIGNINALTGSNLALLKIRLPIGISFFTFQTMSYTIDVYRNQAKAQKNFSTFATFVCLFPQLVAGPIVRYTDINQELECRKVKLDQIAYGIRRFVLGLSKKILIANVLGELCSVFVKSDERTVVFYWMYAVAFTGQIYFDFSGYSDMAIGLGAMFGFTFPENFNYPYMAKSITEFWRRWHITLGSWFRDYVYIPLGGNRVGKFKWMRNIVVVWFLTGMWHGAAWNFIVWGLLFGILLLFEKMWFARYLEKIPNVLKHIYVMMIVILSFVIFNANTLTEACTSVSGMFYFGCDGIVGKESLFYLRDYLVVFVVAIIGATPLPSRIMRNVTTSKIGKHSMSVLEPIGLGVLLLMVTAFLVDGSFNPFLYFRF